MSTAPAASNIPAPILPIYEALRKEVTWLHARWLIYRELYGESQRRIDLLNASAGFFFYVVEEVLRDEVQVCLSKLTDPASKGRAHKNLSLEQLYEGLNAHGDVVIALRCRAILDRLLAECETFRERRNKELAHLDLPTALKQVSTPIPGVSRQMVEDALRSVRELMNAVEVYYDDSETGYEHFVSTSGADALLAVLREGLRYEDLIQQRVLPHDDMFKGEWSDA